MCIKSGSLVKIIRASNNLVVNQVVEVEEVTSKTMIKVNNGFARIPVQVRDVEKINVNLC